MRELYTITLGDLGGIPCAVILRDLISMSIAHATPVLSCNASPPAPRTHLTGRPI